MTECGGTDGEFLSSCKLQETLPATTLLLFGVVMLLCGFKFGTFLLQRFSRACQERLLHRFI